MSVSPELLFNKYDLRDVMEKQQQRMFGEIDDYEANSLLNVSVNDFCDYLEGQYRIEGLALKKDEVYVKEHGEAQVDVRHDFARAIRDRSKPAYVKGTGLTFAVPFSGDAMLLHCQPTAYRMAGTRAAIEGNEILITFAGVDLDAAKVKAEFEAMVNDIAVNLSSVENDIKPFNESLRAKAKERIESRRAKLLKDRGLLASLGYPIREASGVPQTYSVPTVRMKAIIKKPGVTIVPFVPEATLDMEDYEGILRIMTNMSLVMERSPSAFTKMKEEDLRWHFLVQLNGHFEGGATGETFNFEGKTDILIRHEGKNVFIGECMYWDGEGSLMEKIDQVLGYISWRDTKTAIVIFNRNVEFSRVVAQIPGIVKKHKNFKKQVEYKAETGFRFILHHNNDTNRELMLTVLAFDIPQRRGS